MLNKSVIQRKPRTKGGGSMFIIFGGQSYYASGGANDILDVVYGRDFSIAKAVSYIGMQAVQGEPTEWDEEGLSVPIEWVQVYDAVARETIYKSKGKPHADTEGTIRVESK
jgi:hypothetical protein